jgi:hypothetical protein
MSFLKGLMGPFSPHLRTYSGSRPTGQGPSHRNLLRCQCFEPTDTNVKEVVRTMLRRKIIIARFVQVAGPNRAFRDAVTFEVAVAGLCQLSAG